MIGTVTAVNARGAAADGDSSAVDGGGVVRTLDGCHPDCVVAYTAADVALVTDQAARHAERLAARRADWHHRYAPGHSMSVAEYAAALDEVAARLATVPVAVQAPGRALRAILRDGLLNQFHTATSTAVFKPWKRADFEFCHFGIPVDAPADARPRYGFLLVDGFDPAGVSSFGEATLVLAEQVKTDATFCAGDSMNELGQVRPCRFDTPSGDALLSQWVDGDPLTQDWAALPYVEAQVHRPVTAPDIAYVICPQRWRGVVERAGVQWRPRTRPVRGR